MENINFRETIPEKPERSSGEGESFERKTAEAGFEAKDKERMEEILGKLSETKRMASSGREDENGSFEKEDSVVDGLLKEFLSGQKSVDRIADEVKNTGNPYIIDSFHDRLTEKLRAFEKNN